jgi:hypothetical protein
MDAAHWKRLAEDRLACANRLLARARTAEAALRALNAVRPSNWDDDEDPEQTAAWLALDAALRRTP